MPFQPGKSGNPSGRGRPIAEAIKRQIVQFECAERKINQGEAAARIARNVVTLAIDGDKWALEFVADRVDGKPKQHTEHEHSGSVAHEHRAVSETLAWVTESLGAGTEVPLTQSLPH